MKFLYDFIERFLAEVTNLDHFFFSTVRKIFDRIDARALQAVEASYGHFKILNGHLKDFLLDGFLTLYHDLRVFCLVRQIDEQVEMLVEYLGSK